MSEPVELRPAQRALIRAAKGVEAIPDDSHLMLLMFAAFMAWQDWRTQ